MKLSLSPRGDDRFCLHCGNSNPSTARAQDASAVMRFGSALMAKLGPQVIAFATISARASGLSRSWLMVPLIRSRALAGNRKLNGMQFSDRSRVTRKGKCVWFGEDAFMLIYALNGMVLISIT